MTDQEYEQDLKRRMGIIKQIRKTNRFGKFTDDHILYFTCPRRLEAQKKFTILQKIEAFFKSPLSKGYPDSKVVQSTISLLYKEFDVKQSQYK